MIPLIFAIVLAVLIIVRCCLPAEWLKKRKAIAAAPYFAPEEHWWEVSVILMDTYEWTPDMLLKYGMNDATLLKKAKEHFDDKTFDVNLYPSEETLQQSIYTAQDPQDKQALLDKIISRKIIQESRELLRELDERKGTRPIHKQEENLYDYYANRLQEFKTNGTAKTAKILMPSSHYGALRPYSGSMISVYDITYMMIGGGNYIQVTLQHLEQLLDSYDTSQKAARHTARA